MITLLENMPGQGYELPPLASERGSEHFHAGEDLLLLVDDALLNSHVASATPMGPDVYPPTPGFLRLFTPQQVSTRFLTPYSIIDMNRTSVVPLDVWGHLKTDRDFREAYLSDGGPEDLRVRDDLEIAIERRMTEEFAYDLAEGDEVIVREPRRARPHDHRLAAGLAAWDEDTGAGMFESDE